MYHLKVTGDTLYNLVQFNDIPTDKDGRPLHPPKIIRTEVSWYRGDWGWGGERGRGLG